MRDMMSFSIRYVPIISMVFAVSACAHDDADRAANDPASPTNRNVFAGNMFVDHHVLRPAARAYVANIPKPVRGGVHNFGSNLHEPEVFVNDLLQANFSRSWNTLQRFAINTTIGGLGIFEVAQGWGLPHHDADFGQTFGVWGIGTGPDIQLPLLGFSNVRDAFGSVTGLVANPESAVSSTAFTVASGVASGVGVVDARSGALGLTDEIDRSALDKYATLRSMRDQHRAAFILEGKMGRVKQDSVVAAAPDGAKVQGTGASGI